MTVHLVGKVSMLLKESLRWPSDTAYRIRAGDGCSRESGIQIYFFKEGMKPHTLSNTRDLPDSRDVIASRTREPRFEVQLYFSESRPPAIRLVERLCLQCDSRPVSVTLHRSSQHDCHAWASVDQYLFKTDGATLWNQWTWRCILLGEKSPDNASFALQNSWRWMLLEKKRADVASYLKNKSWRCIFVEQY